MAEVVCTCEHAVPEQAPHDSDCPMVTGVVDRRSWEPALARVFRERLKDRKIVAVHCLDSSSISGEVEAVSDDGRVVMLGEGRRRYEIDVERVAIVETARERAGSP